MSVRAEYWAEYYQRNKERMRSRRLENARRWRAENKLAIKVRKHLGVSIHEARAMVKPNENLHR